MAHVTLTYSVVSCYTHIFGGSCCTHIFGGGHDDLLDACDRVESHHVVRTCHVVRVLVVTRICRHNKRSISHKFDRRSREKLLNSSKSHLIESSFHQTFPCDNS